MVMESYLYQINPLNRLDADQFEESTFCALQFVKHTQLCQKIFIVRSARTRNRETTAIVQQNDDLQIISWLHTPGHGIIHNEVPLVSCTKIVYTPEDLPCKPCLGFYVGQDY